LRLENLTFSRGLWSFLQGHGTVFKQSHKHRETVACMVYYCTALCTDIYKKHFTCLHVIHAISACKWLNFSTFLHCTLQKTFYCQQLLTYSILSIAYRYTYM